MPIEILLTLHNPVKSIMAWRKVANATICQMTHCLVNTVQLILTLVFWSESFSMFIRYHHCGGQRRFIYSGHGITKFGQGVDR